MDIIPMGEPLILDAKIPPNLIDKVHAGQDADVRFLHLPILRNY